MHLSYEQGNLFFDLMDSLLLYVNDRFHIVEDFDFDDDDPMLEMKASLVASFLWDNVDVIDGFIAEDTGLDAHSRSILLSWKFPLQDTFTLVRYQDGCALMMNDAGAYRVCGLIDDFDDTTGRVPALVRAVLIPFDGIITYDGFLSMSDVPFSQERSIQDAFEHACASQGIVSTGDALIERARSFNQKRQSDDLDAFFESLSADASDQQHEQLPAGFHRGELAGLSEIERDKAVRAHASADASNKPDALSQLEQRAWDHNPVSSLKDCLAVFPRQRLYEASESLGIPNYKNKSLPALRDDIALELTAYPDDLDDALIWSESEEFATAQAVVEQGGKLSFADADASQHLDDWPLLPYVYLFHSNGVFTFEVPDEVMPLLQSVDFKAYAEIRTKTQRALYSAVACIVNAGIVQVDEAYAQYARLEDEPLSKDAFARLVSGEASYGDLSFEVWRYEGADYLVHYTLCDDYVAEQVVQQHASVAVHQLSSSSESGSAAYQSVLHDLRSGIGKEVDNAQAVRTSLLEAHEHMAFKPIDPVMVERDAYDVLCEQESVRVLRAFLDERVPDGEDDFTFADRTVENIVATAVEVGDRQALISYVDEIGLADCCSDRSRFEQMLMRVFDDMPSWENNGWTAREIRERLTGRRTFYDKRGNEIKVGANDPCPCGSGKPYGECHGRLNG